MELTADIQKIEFEKRDLEYNLDKRNTDYKSLCQEHEQLQSEHSKTQKQLEESTARVSELEAILSAARNQITSLFISISQYLDVNCEREDEIKPNLYAAVRQIFPSSLSHSADSSLEAPLDAAAEASGESSTESSKNEVELMLLSTVDKISLLKSRYHAIQEEIAIKSDSLASQSKQIADLLAVSDSDRATIAKLRAALEKAQSSSSSSVVAAQTDRDSQISELEKTNSTLRAALQSMKASVEQQQRQVNESEARMVQMQNELVEVQRSSSEMVKQMHDASDERGAALQEENRQLHELAEESASEAAALHVLLEQTTKQYDQELTVLRERKYAVEQQVTVSERFLDSSNRAHREELSKLTVSLQEAQKECDALRIQIMEKESELRTALDNYESLRVQATEQMKEVTHQMVEMKARMKEEKEKFDREKESLQLSEHNMNSVIAEKVSAAEQKQKESAREQQRQFEEEVGTKESNDG